MAIHTALNHVTHYRYKKPALLSAQTIRLRPAPNSRTRILSYSLKVTPKDHFINWLQDPHGNFLARVIFPERVKEFKVEVDLVAEMAVLNPFDFFSEEYAQHLPFEYLSSLRHELEPYLIAPVDTGHLFQKFMDEVKPEEGAHTVDYLVALNQALFKKVDYLIRMEPGVQTPEYTLETGCGSCRDSAWLLVNILRHLGLAARFASGYLIQLASDQKSLDGPSGPEIDFTDLHAWTEVYIPGAGWIGLDPTSGLLADEGHIPLACAPEPTSAAAITGAVEKVESEFSFSMSVDRIYESPRVTKPYSDEAWKKLDELGQTIDERLEKSDVRLTMGGEPTFISIDDMDGDEWNTGAVGKNKLVLSATLLKRLWHRFATGGFIHYGQGKWYPGESLPRWAFSCYWRGDGKPLWKNPELLADIHKDYGFGLEDAEKFMKTFGEILGVSTKCLVPAYEDPWYFLWKEQKLPANVDPLDNKLKDPEERQRIAGVFDRGLDVAKGYVLPLQRELLAQSKAHPGWFSETWKIRSKRLHLIPGDSPIGLRLPLDSLPWVPPSRYPFIHQQDPSIVAGQPLPDPEVYSGRRQYAAAASRTEEFPSGEALGEFGPNPQQLPGSDDSSGPDSLGNVVRTALCLEPREGKLFVFFPPVEKSEDYLDLLSAVEETAEKLNMPVVLEGEKPPHDPRLKSFSVTPDPGVIEVNIHPSKSWDELVEKTEALYEEARLTRLGTDKYMLDGRHTGTGGGNHLVIGGETPLDSPFLRRPGLLAGMLDYWHHHPALSYFFSGLFIGPTSQSPRIDEARHDSLYELEIAFSEIERAEGNPPPWMVDRIFRHLLADATGNTHRAEFCIDKLYSPDAASGRRGLLELRSFEMPPHPRMSLAQQLLLRGLIAWLWKKGRPSRELTRWGTMLHDRFMLPHFLWKNLQDVLQDLRDSGLPFEDEWFLPHFEFRFPLYGTVEYGEIKLEIRHALEPWHVLGEEGAAGGTVRFVDSSVERLQIKVTGLEPGRYKVACNGHALPLTPTGQAGEFVAGLRFRAWQPPSCLHPTIPVDAPLTFDLIDTWNSRSVSGCTYYTGHPGGRNYEQFPVNALEAESRRLARFSSFVHTPGKLISLPRENFDKDFPLTLDLRRFAGKRP